MRFTCSLILPLLALGLAPVLNGCGLLFGNVKPVAEKSEVYRVMDLGKQGTDWEKLPSQQQPGISDDNGSSDVAYQSQKTASIISLNSACRPTFAATRNADPTAQAKDLRDFTDLLFLGISDITLRDEKNVSVQGASALMTTLKGKLNNEEMMLQTVVLRRQTCVYDLMYVARPDKFKDNEDDFAHFIASLQFQ